MSLTGIVRNFFLPRQKELERHYTQGMALQKEVQDYLVRHARDTEYGHAHLFANIHDYDSFAAHIPLNTYEELKEYIDRMRHGESDILWPGRTKWYAKSSGTTNDKSKFIPVTADGLKNIHYAGGTDTVALYLRNHPESRLFDGKALILGGSHAPNYNVSHSLVGDLSAILIENINPLVNLVRVPKKQTALLSDFELKRDRIARETLHKNVTNLSGVPSWMMSVLSRVLELSGKRYISDVWPNLEVFFHGGVAFSPYRQQYEELIPKADMNYMETYNASEGFFGLQDDPADPAMLLMLDYGVFYEFIPMDEFGNEHPTVLPLWGVEKGKNYAVVILAYACQQTNAEVSEYTAAPVFMDNHAKCQHQWLIEFAREPHSLQAFADILDHKLQEINSDYEAKRYKNITLQPLQIIKARPGLFNDWLKAKGKLGGQHKIPRLSNSRQYIDELIEINSAAKND